MLLVGLTGGFGSGKSTVASILGELGAEVVDADVLAREVCSPGSDAMRQIADAFGEEVIDAQGHLDRRRLGEIVFANGSKVKQLNSIVHPHVIAREEQMVAQIADSTPDAIVVLDVPLLIEAERHHCVDFLVVVDARLEQRFARLKKKFGDLDRVAMDARIKHQLPLEEKVKLADWIVDNSGTLEETRLQTEDLYARLLQLAQQKTSS